MQDNDRSSWGNPSKRSNGKFCRIDIADTTGERCSLTSMAAYQASSHNSGWSSYRSWQRNAETDSFRPPRYWFGPGGPTTFPDLRSTVIDRKAPTHDPAAANPTYAQFLV
jgi:hypothetical protein